MSKITRIKKAIKAFITAYKNDMSFEENSLYARTDTLKAVEANDLLIKKLEAIAIAPGSLQWKMLDGFMRKCLEKKLGPSILSLYQADNKLIPGLNLDVVSLGDVGKGILKQKITITLHKQLLGTAEIESKMDGGKMLARIKEHISVQ